MVCEDCSTEKDAQATGTGDGHHNPSDELEHSFKKFWRPIAAYTYLAICVFDFVGAPLWIEHTNQTVNLVAFEEIQKFEDKEVQMKAIEQVELGNRSWTPLTLQGGGLFHLAFGAILGVAAFTRGQEKVAAIKQ